jgi:CBS domain-containing protein
MMETQIKDLMTKTLLAVPMGSPVAAAADIMKENKIRHLPVVDELEEIVGIISKRDFKLLGNLQEIPVEQVMSSPVYYIDQDTPLRMAIFKMLDHKISSLLIADDNDDAVGIVTTDDLLWYLVQLLDKDTKENRPFLSVLDTQTLGEVARQLSLAGI